MTSRLSPDEQRARLNELRAAALRRVESLESSFEGIVESTRDVATDDEHDPEGHTIAWERQQIAALRDETKAVLAEIEAAERRLDAGEYGICVVCGGEISPERLEVLPATATCVNCAH